MLESKNGAKGFWWILAAFLAVVALNLRRVEDGRHFAYLCVALGTGVGIGGVVLLHDRLNTPRRLNRLAQEPGVVWAARAALVVGGQALFPRGKVTFPGPTGYLVLGDDGWQWRVDRSLRPFRYTNAEWSTEEFIVQNVTQGRFGVRSVHHLEVDVRGVAATFNVTMDVGERPHSRLEQP